ncbi:MAG: cysteine hydrolase [Erysipelotrichaceae bacterium]|jgi:nicotinamidase-related amidase|nr:cysteine hydrolase [Erysipelotrichaceae bacterium]
MKLQRLLIIVDYQNDFVDGTLGFKGAELLEPYLYQLAKEYEAKGDEVIFTLDTHGDDYFKTIEGQKLPLKHTVKGTKGWEIYGRLKDVASRHLHFEKTTFASDALLEYLKTHQPTFREITLVGLVSHICVTANAIIAKAALPNVPIIVDSKGADSFDKEAEKNAYATLEKLHIEVIK